MSDNLKRLLETVSDPLFQDQAADMANPVSDALDPAIYAAAFNTAAGRAVLADLHKRFVDCSRWYPGEPEYSGHYREGMAQAVFHIAAMVETGSRGDLEDQDAET